MDNIQELNVLWHEIGMRMKNEMCSGKYPAILGVSMVELSILEVIECYPSCMMKRVSEVLGLPKSTLTSAIKRLEEKKYVERNTCSEDRRAYNLDLTEWGLQAQQEHRAIEMSVFQHLLYPLNLKETKMFLTLFSKAATKSEGEHEQN